MRAVLLAKPLTALATIEILLLSFSPFASASTFYDTGQCLEFGNGAFLIMGKPFLFAADTVTFGNNLVEIGSANIYSTVDITLQAFFEDNWFNYTVSSLGTQQIQNGTKPIHVYINDADKAEGNGWSTLLSVVIISAAGPGDSVAVYWNVVESPYRTDQGPHSITYPLLNFHVQDGNNPLQYCVVRVYGEDEGEFIGSWISGQDGYCTQREIPEGKYTYKAEYQMSPVQGNWTHSKDETVQIVFGSPGSTPGLSFRESILKIVIALGVIIAAVFALVKVKSLGKSWR